MRYALALAAAVFAATGLAGTSQAQEDVSLGTGVLLRGLDKIDGDTTDLQIRNGEVARFGSLEIGLRDCRYPVGNPSGDAFASLTIQETDAGEQKVLFDGWMIASSPALNALDHFRYDIWVLRCTVPAGVQDPAQQTAPPPPGEDDLPPDSEAAPVD
ncbi:DUF2155 domain-containing protein [Pseudooceanicola sediminis]|uniref:DUF2155 domain-containing protein n=2 Tax=Pseudooceanicola sediminis TaxID=2211117 RepID=A0A399IXW6_9RHOB|nr:DUF2155 domain-containing protein [Puniceibacterium sp. HSS470]RII37861.1 DUF2155 domain-containing protein [Pseudooceanicola sediminis]